MPRRSRDVPSIDTFFMTSPFMCDQGRVHSRLDQRHNSAWEGMLQCEAMSLEAVAGFWSYAHDDDILDGGAILELAHAIEEEYNLLSGEPLELFVDRSSIAWGDKWRERIDSALSQTTFFIPIITPRYFTRTECRRELLEFAGKAKSLGVDELLLPILYVEVQGALFKTPCN